jgi:hypothetical protein
VSKVLQAIKNAGTPQRFTQDFLAELGFTGGGARPIIPLLKRIGMLGTDGAPTPLYTQFRNPTQSGQPSGRKAATAQLDVAGLGVHGT